MNRKPMPPLYSPSDEVAAALQENRPVVALESTLIAHGLPWPANLETAQAMEEAVRRQGAVPATTAVVDGEVRIGLEAELLERAARGEGFEKAGVRDLPAAVASGGSAATTVGSTLFVAHRAGVAVMATGGIGGVHRGAAQSGDVSADVLELSRTPVAVVCSGVKAILDLPQTVELLETFSIPVIGYGTDELPAFYSSRSGIRLERRVDNPDQAAELILACRRLSLPAGALIANPPPAESALDWTELEGMIERAAGDAERARLSGKEVTPFLLARIRELSGGRSLIANQALAVENARLAGRIARRLADASPTG